MILPTIISEEIIGLLRQNYLARGVIFKGCSEVQCFVEVIVGQIIVESPYESELHVKGYVAAKRCVFGMASHTFT